MHADFRIALRQLLAFFLALTLAKGFYIPGIPLCLHQRVNELPLKNGWLTFTLYAIGWSIKSYKDDEPIPLFVNKIYSDNSQLQYAYYDLPFVRTLLFGLLRQDHKDKESAV